jgi:hypothetical protein
MPATSLPKATRAMMRFLARFMPACREVSRMVSDGMDRRLPLRRRLLIRMHVSMCVLCRRYEKQLHLVREGVGRYANPETHPAGKVLSPAARARLKEALTRKG